jgi:hypothetical protein
MRELLLLTERLLILGLNEHSAISYFSLSSTVVSYFSNLLAERDFEV